MPPGSSKKNAALFFGAVFVFRAILAAFDSQDGLQKMLSLLHDAASVRFGVLLEAYQALGLEMTMDTSSYMLHGIMTAKANHGPRHSLFFFCTFWLHGMLLDS